MVGVGVLWTLENHEATVLTSLVEQGACVDLGMRPGTR